MPTAREQWLLEDVVIMAEASSGRSELGSRVVWTEELAPTGFGVLCAS